MPILRRNAAPLLRQVNNKPHATNKHHEEDSLPTPPASNSMSARRDGSASAETSKSAGKQEEDIYADPASSSDEEDAAALPTASKSATFRHSRTSDGVRNTSANTGTFKLPAAVEKSGSNISKRSSSNEDEDAGASSSSDDKMVFSSQQSQSPNKRARLAAAGKARRVGNIHAPIVKSNATYGKKKILTSKDRKIKQPQSSGFKNAKSSCLVPPKAQAPVFKAAKGADMFAFGQDADATPGFQAARGGVPDSPELSELSEPDSDVEEIDVSTLGLPIAQKYVATKTCDICGVSVPLLLKQEFEDRYTHGKALDYKWQQRFCRHHKAETAREVWTERGYPQIRWESLGKRLQGHHDKLVAVLEGKTHSAYRDRLQKVVDSRATRSARTAYNKSANAGDDDGLEIKPGYYGPRGEKAMTEHILSDFSGELRGLAVSDALVAAAGVAGGVSGFVQAVLVPEVAVLLVKEDMKVDMQQARKILAESWELGELLNEEADEKVESVDSGDEEEEQEDD
jgi:hypothetical protein